MVLAYGTTYELVLDGGGVGIQLVLDGGGVGIRDIIRVGVGCRWYWHTELHTSWCWLSEIISDISFGIWLYE